MPEVGKRLLILSCSARKREESRLLPAIERYDGPMWQVVRQYMREQPLFASDLDVFALSAEYGLIPGAQEIPAYERLMTEERALELRPQVEEALKGLLQSGYEQVRLGLSQRYLPAVVGWEKLVPAGIDAVVTNGPFGVKLGRLRAWLRGEKWESKGDQRSRMEAPADFQGEATIAGTRIRMTRDEVLEAGRRALQVDGAGASKFRDWCVLIDGKRVSPKWLVGVISGRPTTSFEAGAARRALTSLGVDIEYVGRSTEADQGVET